MAVDARHLHPFPQILSNRELGLNGVESSGNVFGAQIGYGVGAPLSPAAMEFTVPVHSSSAITAAVNPVETPQMKSECVLNNIPISRKRSRETINSLLSSFPCDVQSQNANQRCGVFTSLSQDILFPIQQQQQLEIDRFIAQHNETVRLEIEDQRNRYRRRIAAALEHTIMKKLKAQDDEIQKIGKLNWALEERAKSLYVENQIWRDLAQTNEATANALRSNIAQLLSQMRRRTNDEQSCCGSNFEATDRRRLADTAATEIPDCNYKNTTDRYAAPMHRLCRSCKKQESCVLLLPCRHLCLCADCGSTLHTCPVCNSPKTGSVHLNLSS